MDLRQLRYFSAVLTFGSFSRAAEQLHVAQSAISRQIQALEEEIGVKLLRRKPKLEPTEAGALLLERASSIIGQVRSLRDEVREYAEVPKGILRVGMIPFSSRLFMPRAIARFAREFPQVRLQIQTAMSGILISWLRDDKIDIAIMHSPWNGLGFTSEPLAYSRMVLVLPPAGAGGPLGAGIKGAYGLGEVAAMPLILPTPENPQRILLEGAILSQGMTLNVTMEADNLGTILGLVQEGLGCTVVTYAAVHDLVGHGAVRIATLEHAIQTDISWVTDARRSATAAVRQFCVLVRAEVEAVARREGLPPGLFQLGRLRNG